MQDVQSRQDTRGIAIQRVGISNTFLPMIWKDSSGSQGITTKFKFTVDLPETYKGTHMSRFQEILLEWQNQIIDYTALKDITAEALQRLDASSSHLALSFKYFITKTAPISGKKSLMDIDCHIEVNCFKQEKYSFDITLAIPATSLCPCSKEISQYGAHNQRSIITIRYCFDGTDTFIDIPQLVQLIENQASCEVYPLLKREDEKYVTEHAYENPKFVEDILRDCVIAMRKIPNLDFFEVECENMESIHSHNAYASHIEYNKEI